MKKKFYSFLSLLLGVAGIVVAGIFKEALGKSYRIVLIISVIVILVSAIEMYVLVRRKDIAGTEPDEKELPEYRRKKAIMSRPEIDCFSLLSQLFGEKYLILPQVALHTVIDKLTQNSYRSELFRVADFCLCDKETFAPLLLIELNDSSHNRADRIERDKKVALICERADLPMIVFTLQELSDTQFVRKSVQKNVLKKG